MRGRSERRLAGHLQKMSSPARRRSASHALGRGDGEVATGLEDPDVVGAARIVTPVGIATVLVHF